MTPVWIGIHDRVEDVLRSIAQDNGYFFDLGARVVTHGRENIPVDDEGIPRFDDDFVGVFIEGNTEPVPSDVTASKNQSDGIALWDREVQVHAFIKLKNLDEVDAWLLPAERLKLDVKRAVMGLNNNTRPNRRIKGLKAVLPVAESMNPPSSGELSLNVSVTFEFTYTEAYA